MAIAFVKSAQGVNNSSTAVAPAFASATTAGNLIVLSFAADAYNGTPDTGWTQSANCGLDDGTIFHGSYIWWRISAGETSFTVTVSPAASSAWCISEWSGVDPSPFDIAASQYVNSSGALYTTPSVTPTSGNRLLIANVSGWSNSANLNGAYSAILNSFTEVTHAGVTGVADRECVLQARSIVAANGSTTYSTGATYPVSVASRSAIIASFKEAAAGGSGKPVKVWSGSAWVTKTLKVWSGSAWVTKPAKVWSGSAWV